MYAMINNDMVAYAEARLHIGDLAIQRGFGVFDYFRVEDGALLYVEEHIERLFASARGLGIAMSLSPEEILDALVRLTKKNRPKMAGSKIIVTGGYAADGYTMSHPNILIIQTALTPQQKSPRLLRIITHEYAREFPEIKTINYSMGIRLQKRLREEGKDDVLYYHDEILEFPRSNFFIVDAQGTLRTAHRNILRGITRKHVLQVASTHYQAEENRVTLAETYTAREAFLASSTRGLEPVVEIDGQPVGDGKPGKVTLHLQTLLAAYEANYLSHAPRYV